ncbi:MAG: GNAT family N-acetyltransferase [Caldimonas sp.]
MAPSNDLADIDAACALVALGAAHAPAILAHLLRLPADDRSLRFCAGTVPADVVAKYVDSIRFGEDSVLGVVDAHGSVVAVGHACWFRSRDGLLAEASFSVDEAWRNRGIGRALLLAVRAAAAEREASAVIGQCLARNRAMRRVFAAAGMTMTQEDGEVQAHGATTTMTACLPPPSAAPASRSIST